MAKKTAKKNTSKKPVAGKVYLAGAGPGDPGLLTLRAAEVLGNADVVFYDRLVHPRILEHARADARRVDVGKQAGDHTVPQRDIEKLLIQEAKQGHVVVRIKGGDPFVFGRGAEEALALQGAAVPFEVIPGVTSAVAVPSFAGIPLTHREFASSCAIVTGHEDPTKGFSAIQWEHLAKGVDTIVFLMGTKTLKETSRRLIQAGLKKGTPCAVISAGTYPTQRTVVGTLATIQEKVEKAMLATPTILVVGQVVRLRNKLAWFENRPLFGQTVLVTRAREQASDLVKRLEGLGAQAYEAPTIRITPPDSHEQLDHAIGRLHAFSWIFFTSVNGVKSFLARIRELGRDIAVLRDAKMGVIGSATAEALQREGLRVDLLPKRFVAEGILEELDRRRIVVAGQEILLVRAQEVRDVLGRELIVRGAKVTQAIAYKTVAEKAMDPSIAEGIREGKIRWITFTSSSTVKNFFAMSNGSAKENLKRLRTASIGPITSQTLRDLGHEPSVEAKDHNIDGLIAAILKDNRP